MIERGSTVNRRCYSLAIRLISCLLLTLVTVLWSDTQLKASTKKQVDLIVYGEYVVTMREKDEVIKDGAVAILNNKILAVGKQNEILKSYFSPKQIDGENKILMPGLINGHTHSAMTLFRGIADDLKLMDWLNNYIFPLEGQFVDQDFIRTGTQLACWEMIKGGTTTFVDMYFYPEVISKAVVDCGLRAIIGSPSIDYPSPGFKGWDDSFSSAVNYVTTWQGKHERITPAFAPHAPYTVSPEHLKQVSRSAVKLGAPITIHLAESTTETKIIKERYNATVIEHVSSLGLLDDVNLIAAHLVHLTDLEIRLLAKRNIGAIHNPSSNLKLAAGVSPIVKMLDVGVLVGLGTDGAASNNDLDMWEEMRLAALIHKAYNDDSTAIPAYTALNMATKMGAEAIGLGDITGQLSPGYRADMIQVSFDDLRLMPIYDVISHLVYVIDSSDVVTNIVSGKVLMQEGKVLSMNESELKSDVTLIAKKIKNVLTKTKSLP
jgi:5-methylthioadenosine/S-adenosylhomocysteine deaminase